MAEQTKNKILNMSLQLFTKFGFKRVTMDDLSQQLAISKKTLYKYFLSKDNILESVFEWKKDQVHKKVNKILDDTEIEYMDKVNSIFEYVTKQISSMPVEFLREIQFHKPELWESMQSYKKESIFSSFNKLVEEGQEKGYIRTDIDKAVFVSMYYHTILNIITPDFLSTVSYSNQQVYHMIIKVFFKGIFTDKGREKSKIESLNKG